MSDYLFTYGTLHPGYAPDEIAAAVDTLRLVGKGYVFGVLYDLGEYPGAVLDPASDRKITGSVFRLPEDASVLSQLDEYEGFDQKSPEQSLFLRTLQSITLDCGDTLPCWVYVYNQKTETARMLPGGVFQISAQGADRNTDLPG